MSTRGTAHGIPAPEPGHRPPGGGGDATHNTARYAVLRTFRAPSRAFRIATVVLAALVLLAVVAWIVQLRDGMGVAGYTDRSFWAIYIADVVAFIGVSYGGAVVSAILMLAGASWRAPLVRIAEGVALVTVIVGAAYIIPHLGRPDRLIGMITHANTSSPVFWDMVAILTYLVATVVFFVLPLIPDAATLLAEHPDELGRFRTRLYRLLSRGWIGSVHQRQVLHRAMTVVAIAIIPVAVAVHSVLSWAFALMNRPGWHESIWAPYFVIAALYSGVALVIVVVAAFRRGYHLEAFITERHFARLAFIMVTLGATYVYLTFADLLPSGYAGERSSQQIIAGMLNGPAAVLFWIFVVVGTLLPIVLVAVRRTRTVTGIVLASVLVIVGMWIKRLVMVIETASYDTLTRSFGAMFQFTWVSAAATLGGVAAIALLLMLLFRAVPLLAITEMGETNELAGESPAPSTVSVDASGAVKSLGQNVTRSAVVLLAVMAPLLSSASGVGAGAAAGAGHPAYPVWSARSARYAVAPAATGTPTLTLAAAAAGEKNTLTAKVMLDGVPVKGALVNFFESTPMFKASPAGPNRVPVGSMETDDTGTAVVSYVAAVTGVRTVIAQYYPTALGDAVESAIQVDVQQARTYYQPTAPGLLVGAGHTLTLVLFGLVAVVLMTVVGQLFRVRRAGRRG